MESFHEATLLTSTRAEPSARKHGVTASGYSRALSGGETDLSPRRLRWRRKEWQKLLVNVAQCGVMFEEGFIDLGQSLQDGRIRREFFALLDKCANYIYAHGDRSIAPEDVCHLKRAVFRECPRAIANVSL